ncbi:MAG: hypothetical protein ABI193_26095, partial [Minicystis sp.]
MRPAPRLARIASLAAARAAILAAGLALGAGCSSPSADARVIEMVPDRASFPAVAQAMEHGCGSLDCHGSTFRNLRIFGNEGLRALASDRPLTPPCTTSLEV